MALLCVKVSIIVGNMTDAVNDAAAGALDAPIAAKQLHGFNLRLRIFLL